MQATKAPRPIRHAGCHESHRHLGYQYSTAYFEVHQPALAQRRKYRAQGKRRSEQGTSSLRQTIRITPQNQPRAVNDFYVLRATLATHTDLNSILLMHILRRRFYDRLILRFKQQRVSKYERRIWRRGAKPPCYRREYETQHPQKTNTKYTRKSMRWAPCRRLQTSLPFSLPAKHGLATKPPFTPHHKSGKIKSATNLQIRC